MKLTHAAAFVMLVVPAARAVDVTPWDSMPRTVIGSITVKAKSGKKATSDTAFFDESAITLLRGPSIRREDVREVTVRAARSTCCDGLWLGTYGVLVGAGAVTEGEVVGGIAVILLCAPIAAVTLPPALAIYGARHLIPTKLLYKVSP